MTARVHEDDAKRLLAAGGVAVPDGEAAVAAGAARAAAARLGGKVVVKALVLANRRGKSGGVIFADTPADAGRAAAAILGRTVAGANPEAVLVEERLDLERELFLSFVLDSGRRRAVALASLDGGVDVESAAGAGGAGLHPLGPGPPPGELASPGSSWIGGSAICRTASGTCGRRSGCAAPRSCPWRSCRLARPPS